MLTGVGDQIKDEEEVNKIYSKNEETNRKLKKQRIWNYMIVITQTGVEVGF
jgi:hypothetical protein